MDTKQMQQNINHSKHLRRMAATYNKFAATMIFLAILGYYGAAVTLKDKAYLAFAIFITTGVINNIQAINTLAKAQRYNKQALKALQQNTKTK